MGRLDGKVALITGGARGMGKSHVRHFVAEGARVIFGDVLDDKGAYVAAGLGEQACRYTRLDVTSEADWAAATALAIEAFGSLDVLVNNAGILKTAPLAQSSDELFAQTFAINVGGVFNTLREAATRLNDGGRIINLSSTTLALNLPGYSVYNGTKAAVEAFSRVFAKELRGRRITVNCVAPGPVATELFLNGKTEEQIAQFSKMPPLERLGQPDDISGVVAFLAGKDGAWVNGQVLRANGGLA